MTTAAGPIPATGQPRMAEYVGEHFVEEPNFTECLGRSQVYSSMLKDFGYDCLSCSRLTGQPFDWASKLQEQRSLKGRPFLRRSSPRQTCASESSWKSSSASRNSGWPRALEPSRASCILPIAVTSSLAMARRCDGTARLRAGLAARLRQMRSPLLRRCCEKDLE